MTERHSRKCCFDDVEGFADAAETTAAGGIEAQQTAAFAVTSSHLSSGMQTGNPDVTQLSVAERCSTDGCIDNVTEFADAAETAAAGGIEAQQTAALAVTSSHLSSGMQISKGAPLELQTIPRASLHISQKNLKKNHKCIFRLHHKEGITGSADEPTGGAI